MAAMRNEPECMEFLLLNGKFNTGNPTLHSVTIKHRETIVKLNFPCTREDNGDILYTSCVGACAQHDNTQYTQIQYNSSTIHEVPTWSMNYFIAIRWMANMQARVLSLDISSLYANHYL